MKGLIHLFRNFVETRIFRSVSGDSKNSQFDSIRWKFGILCSVFISIRRFSEMHLLSKLQNIEYYVLVGVTRSLKNILKNYFEWYLVKKWAPTRMFYWTFSKLLFFQSNFQNLHLSQNTCFLITPIFIAFLFSTDLEPATTMLLYSLRTACHSKVKVSCH